MILLVGIDEIPYVFFNAQSRASGRCETPDLIGWSISLAL